MAPRTYHSPLREQQARQTRAQILDALIVLVGERGPADLPIRDLAARAGVAERTVYRHFPDRAALLDGLTDHVGELAGWFDPRRDRLALADMPEAVVESFATYDAHADAVRAMAMLNLDPARTATLSRVNRDWVRRAVAEAHPELDEAKVAEAAAVLHLLASSRTWMRYRFEEGLAPEQAQRAARRSILAVLTDLEGAAGERSG